MGSGTDLWNPQSTPITYDCLPQVIIVFRIRNTYPSTPVSDECHFHQSLRGSTKDHTKENNNTSKNGLATKVLWYLPIVPELVILVKQAT